MENLRSLEPQAKIPHSYKKKRVYTLGTVVQIGEGSSARLTGSANFGQIEYSV